VPVSGFGPPPGAPEEEPRRRRASYLPPGVHPGGLVSATGPAGAAAQGLALPGQQTVHAGAATGPAAGLLRPHGRFPVASAHKPGIIALRPLALGDILDGAVKSFRRNPRSTAGLSALVNAVAILPPVLLVGLVTTGRWFSTSRTSTVVDTASLSTLLLAAGAAFAMMVLSGLLSYAVAEASLGRRPGIAETWRAVRGRLVRLVGLQLAVGTGLASPLVLLVVLLVLVADGPVAVILLVSVVLGLTCAAWGAWFGTRTLLAAPALVLEKRGVVDALRRAWTLSKGSFWRLFGTWLLASSLGMIVFWVIQLPLMLVGFLLLALLHLSPGPTLFLSTLNVNLATLLACTLVTPFLAAVTCLQYIDARMRREGFDLVLIRVASAGRGERR